MEFSLNDLIGNSSVLDYLVKLSGPPALVVSIVAFTKQILQVKKLNAETNKLIDDKLTAQITRMKMVEEMNKLIEERLTAEITREKVVQEINKIMDERITGEISRTKLVQEIRTLKASAISNEMLARRNILDFDRIIKLLDDIEEEARLTYEDLRNAYKIFEEPTVNKHDLQTAYPDIANFIDGRTNRGKFEGYVRELEGLLPPFHGTIGDELTKTMWEFSGEIFKSRQKFFKRKFVNSEYQLTSGQILEIKEWVDAVRRCYDDLSEFVGYVRGEVRASTAWRADPSAAWP
jgi:hypothetical protein